MLRPELAVDTEQVQRFFNEARATSAYPAPEHCRRGGDVGQLEGGVPFLVMELLDLRARKWQSDHARHQPGIGEQPAGASGVSWHLMAGIRCLLARLSWDIT